ncbi:site-2 protease family protein [Paenibacillus flagellatus]|uniref:Site-2 protease family protein n=1 Tax=Paenibacillus flagellatus TaxID=2211139 RepID=A0A2V5KKN4_9BACL|nr:site-2 protease family protein [Paenibacillus flagellatus]PYI51187.1 site-2 protease family protein [Paenibacillus flagellatus]
MDNANNNKPIQKNGRWLLGAVGVFLLTKAKSILALLKFSKFGSAFLSMLLTIGAYTIVYPFQVAIGLVVMLLVHEMGHVLAAKRKGVPASAPYFIPFLGAAILLKRNPRDAETEAYIGIGGPLLGTIGAGVAFVIGWLGLQADGGAGWYVWIVIAKIGFILNLFNLLPMKPLDGGRIASAVSRWLWAVGLIGGAVAIIWFHAWILILFWALFAYDLYKKYIRRAKKDPHWRMIRWETPLAPLLEAGYFIPGEEHKRELPFTTSSTLDGVQSITVRWDGLGLDHTFELADQQLIEKVQVGRIERQTDGEEPKLIIFLMVQGHTHESDVYYDVPAKTRLGFGLAYFGLAAFLIGMLGWIGTMKVPPVG